MTCSDLTIRPVRETDDLAALTELLHRAYKPLADQGMRYVASYQTEDVTRRRLGRGQGYLALLSEALVGTVTLYSSTSFNECAWYQRPGIWFFGQFAVDPAYQRQGVGAALMDWIEGEAQSGGAAELALDTSEHAADLIAYYARRGYRPVGTVQWPVTNYRSVVLSKLLR